MRAALLLIVSLAGFAAAPARAASFDCAKAAHPTEQAVCADPSLSRLDDELGQAFAAAVKATPMPRRLRAEQADWLVTLRGSRPEPARLGELYRERVAALAAYPALIAAMQAPVPVETARKSCTPLPLPAGLAGEPCSVVDFCEIAGPDGKTYFGKVQRYGASGQARAVATVLLAAAGPEKAKGLAWAVSEGGFAERPRVVESPAGLLLHFPAFAAGTMAQNIEQVLRREGDRLVELDVASWRRDLKERLPPDLAVTKGLRIDYPSLTAQAPLARENDPDCCATGGRADLSFAIEERRLVLRDVTIRPGAAWAKSDDRVLCGRRVATALDKQSFVAVDPEVNGQDYVIQAASLSGPALLERAANDLCAAGRIEPQAFAGVRLLEIRAAEGADDPLVTAGQGRLRGALALEWAWNEAETPSLASVREGLLCHLRPTRACADRRP